MQSHLHGQRIAVTGGFGALGRAMAAVLGAAGARVALIDRATPPADLPPDILAIGGVDLGDAAAARDAMAGVVSAWGVVDGLVNVAGGFVWERIEGGSAATWERMYAVNVRTTLLASQAVLPHLLSRGRGRIVNIGSLGAAQAGTGMGAYAAAKAGVAQLTLAMADEVKDSGITVNALLPGTIDTPANRADMPQADTSRWVAAAAIAEVAAFLLSDAASAVNGALIPVKGRG